MDSSEMEGAPRKWSYERFGSLRTQEHTAAMDFWTGKSRDESVGIELRAYGKMSGVGPLVVKIVRLPLGPFDDFAETPFLLLAAERRHSREKRGVNFWRHLGCKLFEIERVIRPTELDADANDGRESGHRKHADVLQKQLASSPAACQNEE